eukprot:Opistho-2@80037
MLATVQDFFELLQQDAHIDMEKLRDLAQHGVPSAVRGEVWKLLLGVAQPDQGEEVSNSKAQTVEYERFRREHSDVVSPETLKRMEGEIKRYHPEIDALQGDGKKNALQTVVSVYLNTNSDVDYNAGFIHLCGPFVLVAQDESTAFHLFSSLMSALKPRFVPSNINKVVADFVSVFRMLQPELYSHFEEEELEPNEWAVSWLQFLFARELPMRQLLRLWDTYFSLGSDLSAGFDLHFYVCLAVLDHCKEDLEELDYSDIKAYLQRLPAVEMDQILAHAKSIREDSIARKLV